MPSRSVVLTAVLLLPILVRAGDWPTYRGDLGRRGVSAEKLDLARLRQQWLHRCAQPPRPAWPGPARWDAYNRVPDLRSLRNYDPVFHVVAVGDSIFFGSSAEDAVCCLDAATGKERWCFIASGPVRIAPTSHDNRVYFGSDDGCAYCLDARNGQLIWKVRAAPELEMVVHQQRLISFWPVRTGVLVVDGTAYFGASLLPWKKSYLCAVDAVTGKVEGPARYVHALDQVTLEGAMLSSERGLIAPQGRVEPLLFDRATGNPSGKLQGSMGCFVLLTEDEQVLQGPGNRKGALTISNPATRTRVAAFPRANSAVVRGELACLVDDHAIIALNRKTGTQLWRRSRPHVHEVLLADNALLVGGRDEVLALDVRDGGILWTAPVQGRAHGLALAQGRLLVSTDEGVIHCFTATEAAPSATPPEKTPVREPDQPLRPVAEVKDPHLLGRWVFQQPHVQTLSESKNGVQGTVADLAGAAPGQIQGPVDLVRAGQLQALSCTGAVKGVELASDFRKANLPKEAFTATTWVRIDQPQPWGGILGAMQDNGPYERGFLLGYRADRFCLGVAAENGKNVMTYLTAKEPFQPERWYHVAGVYDGQEMHLYVNGELSASSKAQKGPIRWPGKAVYYLGAYRDDDEHFPLLGQIHEVRLYGRVLTPAEIHKHHGELKEALPPPPAQPAKTDPLRLAEGPTLRFPSATTAVVRWETAEPVPTMLEFGEGKSLQPRVEKTPRTRHEVTLMDLRRDRLYHYRILAQLSTGVKATELFECDTHLNFLLPSPPQANPFPETEALQQARRTAARLRTQAQLERGLCVVVGLRDGRLAWELAAGGLQVLAVDDEAARVEQLRRQFRATGRHGSFIALLQVDNLKQLPLPPCCANLVTSERCPDEPAAQLSAAQLTQVVRPGGMAIFQTGKGREALQQWAGKHLEFKTGWSDPAGHWLHTTRPELPGAAAWSHQYGRPDNAAFTGEALGEARSTSDLEVAWLGDPGPRFQGDRNPRKPAPLAINGRLFVQGFGRFLALDAFNGTFLWALDVPRATRFNVLRDCSNWCADEHHVYLAAGDSCWQLDARTGERRQTWRLSTLLGKATADRDWGYVARLGEVLLGSSVQRDSAYRGWWGQEHWYDAKAGTLNQIICSDTLFALPVREQKPTWVHRGGAILNPSITASDGRVFFVESRNPVLKEKASGRLGEAVWKDLHLVALDLDTGKTVWSRPIQPLPGQAAFYLALGGGKLVLVSSEKGRFGVSTFDPRGGAPRWDRTFKWVADHHGAHLSRPAILGPNLFLKPWVLDLSTGEKKAQLFPKGHGCGSYVVTEKMVICRAGELCAWDWEKNQSTRWSRLRPDCWISTIPACGMLLSPEGGGGCSCGGWLDVSLGLLPRKRR